MAYTDLVPLNFREFNGNVCCLGEKAQKKSSTLDPTPFFIYTYFSRQLKQNFKIKTKTK